MSIGLGRRVLIANLPLLILALVLAGKGVDSVLLGRGAKLWNNCAHDWLAIHIN